MAAGQELSVVRRVACVLLRPGRTKEPMAGQSAPHDFSHMVFLRGDGGSSVPTRK